jgi:hypothetical protein
MRILLNLVITMYIMHYIVQFGLIKISNTGSELQVVSLLNEVYSTVDPQNEHIYDLKKISTNDVYKLVTSKTDCMNSKSELAFATWCSKKKINFMNAPIIRKRQRGANSRYRELYVLKDEYIGDISLVLFAKITVMFA